MQHLYQARWDLSDSRLLHGSSHPHRYGKTSFAPCVAIYGSGIQKYFASHLPAKEAAVLNRLLRRVARDE